MRCHLRRLCFLALVLISSDVTAANGSDQDRDVDTGSADDAPPSSPSSSSSSSSPSPLPLCTDYAHELSKNVVPKHAQQESDEQIQAYYIMEKTRLER